MNDPHAASRSRRSGRDPRRFDPVTIALHWSTVALLAAMFASAWLGAMATSHQQASLLLAVHRSCGVTVWVVVVGRLIWRLGFGYMPDFPPAMPGLQRTLATLSEYGLYALVLVQPLTGMAQSLTRGRPFPLLGLQVPAVMARDKVLTGVLHAIHAWSAWTLLGLVAVHILAALFHRFVLRDGVFASMAPLPPSARPAAQKLRLPGNKPAGRFVSRP